MDARCGCPIHDDHGFCEHRAAIVVLELWRRPDGRELFERPTWQLELDYLLPEHGRQQGLHAETEAPAPAELRRPCRLRVQLFRTGGYAQGFDFELRLIRSNKRGDGWLKPIKCPSDPDALRAKAKPSEALLHVHDLIVQLGELRKVDAFS
ncbi:MAG: hypothetical protein KC457_33620, partial [Myxococcales bacterium]|nr:hypothetical protein [Myxococcales bacterium]